MAKITFMGAGSTIFAKNILGDVLVTPALRDSQIALYDIDPVRLKESESMLETLNASENQGRGKITSYLGVPNRKKALTDADYVVNAIQVGGYDPSTKIDFAIPKKYGLQQTIGDTMGIGGLFRALRTLPVMRDFAREMEEVCPEAWFLNYTNPMSVLSGFLQRYTGIRTVGLCHSVQECAVGLLRRVGLPWDKESLSWEVAGINHMGWLLRLGDKNGDLYPGVKKRAGEMNREARKKGAAKHDDMVRFEIMRHFGYYVTESSEHNAEYSPYWIKDRFPQLIEEFNIPLDEYPRRCVEQIAGWKEQSKTMVGAKKLEHQRTLEYGSYIMEAMETDVPFRIHGNVLNRGMIPNLPDEACVEVPCLVDRNGVQSCYAGALPEQLAALNRGAVNVHLLTIEAGLNRKRESIYHAAMVDPHTAGELTLDQIREMCDELILAHEGVMDVLG